MVGPGCSLAFLGAILGAIGGGWYGSYESGWIGLAYAILFGIAGAIICLAWVSLQNFILGFLLNKIEPLQRRNVRIFHGILYGIAVVATIAYLAIMVTGFKLFGAALKQQQLKHKTSQKGR